MSQQRFCPTCKQLNSQTAADCIHCGTPLPLVTQRLNSTTAHFGGDGQTGILEPDIPPQIAGLTQGSFALTIADQEPFVMSERREILLGGKSPNTNTLNLIDLTPYDAVAVGVSRKHLKITPKEQGEGFTVQDLSSSNGTWLNSVRLVPDQPYPLRHGDQLRLGKLRVKFYYLPRQGQEPLAN